MILHIWHCNTDKHTSAKLKVLNLPNLKISTSNASMLVQVLESLKILMAIGWWCNWRKTIFDPCFWGNISIIYAVSSSKFQNFCNSLYLVLTSQRSTICYFTIILYISSIFLASRYGWWWPSHWIRMFRATVLLKIWLWYLVYYVHWENTTPISRLDFSLPYIFMDIRTELILFFHFIT